PRAAARRECIERRRRLLVRWVSRSRVRHPGHASPTRRMTMEIEVQAMPAKPRREPWNKGKLIGQKPPLRPRTCWIEPYPIADGGAEARLGDVQSGNRQ